MGILIHQQLSALKEGQTNAVQRSSSLSVHELVSAENYWFSISQGDHFMDDILSITSNHVLPPKSCLLSLHPFLDSSGILRVGGRKQNAKLSYSSLHPVSLQGKRPVTKLIICTSTCVCCTLDPLF